MPSRFTSGAYEPEVVALMGEAFELAWKDARWARPEARRSRDLFAILSWGADKPAIS
jgi:hypothetical protein